MTLTEQQIQELPAGRETDAMVAEALGWKRKSAAKVLSSPRDWIRPDGEDDWVPRYSTEIQLAVHLLSYLLKDSGLEPKISYEQDRTGVCEDGSTRMIIRCHLFAPLGDGSWSVSGYAVVGGCLVTALEGPMALAITRAFLLAKLKGRG